VTFVAAALAADLERLSGRPVVRDADLRLYGRWRTGGRAAVVVEPANGAAVKACLAYLADKPVPRLVIGDGSNILFDDRGFDGVLLRIGQNLSAVHIDGQDVTAEGGIWVPTFVRRLGQHGLGGLEHAIGIPGTLGGLVVMNGGSRRQGVGDDLVRVRGCDARGVPFERDRAACAFRYRGSTLQDDGLIILEADFHLKRVDPAALRCEMIGIMVERRRKFPKAQPNCGSVFLSDPAMYEVVGPPGAAIERVGLKGRQMGQAQISPLHANFIVNLGTARSDDILGLIHLARTTVHDSTGFWMDAEVRHIAPDGRVRQAHVAAAERAAA
jgi:UDP-N-acetylmuramate dehydrogenase